MWTNCLWFLVANLDSRLGNIRGWSKNRRDRTEHPSRSWRPYRRPDDTDETRRTTGQQSLPINENLVVGARPLFRTPLTDANTSLLPFMQTPSTGCRHPDWRRDAATLSCPTAKCWRLNPCKWCAHQQMQLVSCIFLMHVVKTNRLRYQCSLGAPP